MSVPNSKPLRISAVCRANEVRSRIIEGYLKKRYPQSEVRSFGTDVVEGSRISAQLTREMKNWGLEINQTPPTSAVSEIDFISASDMVISADHAISEKLSRVGIVSINICEFAVDEWHIPSDPINFSNEKYFANAAKIIHCTARMISEVVEKHSKTGSVWTYPTSEKAIPGSLRSGAIIVDARLRKPSSEALPSGETKFYVEHELAEGLLISSLDIRTRVYAPKFEFSAPERAFLSNEWSDFIRAVSKFGPVNVITAPLTANRRILWEPYLASIVAAHVEYG